MTIQIALLRAVNVGGRGAVAMSDLRDFIATLGFKDAQSLLQSGNLVFDAGRQAGPALEALRAAIKGREVIRAAGRHLYIVYPDGIGRSRLTNAVIEGKLGTRGTGRNWNTVLKLVGLVREVGGSGGR